MLELIISWLACVLSFTGFVLIAMSQDRHWEAVTALPTAQRVSGSRLRTAGVTLHCLACPLAVLAQGTGFGVLLWGIGSTAMAMSVAVILAWHPRWMIHVALACKRLPSGRQRMRGSRRA